MDGMPLLIRSMLKFFFATVLLGSYAWAAATPQMNARALYSAKKNAGKPGPKGPRGDLGPTGPAGLNEVRAYGCILNVQGPETLTVFLPESVVPLDSSYNPGNFNLEVDLDNSRIKIAENGVYVIRFNFKAFAKKMDSRGLYLVLCQLHDGEEDVLGYYRLDPIPLFPREDGWEFQLLREAEQSTTCHKGDIIQLFLKAVPADAPLSEVTFVSPGATKDYEPVTSIWMERIGPIDVRNDMRSQSNRAPVMLGGSKRQNSSVQKQERK